MGHWGALPGVWPADEGGSPPLLSLLSPQLEHGAQCWAPQFRADWELLGEPRGGCRAGGDRLRTSGLFTGGREGREGIRSMPGNI